MTKTWLKKNYADIYSEISRKGYSVRGLDFFGSTKSQATGRIGILRKMEKRTQNKYYHSIFDRHQGMLFIGKKRRIRV